MKGPIPHRRGFSLLEILVAITVMAILIAIAAPVLSHMMGTARQVERLSWGRQLGLVVELYTVDYDGAYPFLATPGSPGKPIMARGVPVASPPLYNRYFWLNAVHPDYLDASIDAMPCVLDGGPPDGVFGNVPKGVLLSGWTLSSTTAAAPAFWHTDAPADPTMLRAMGVHHAAHPSRKGLIERGLDGRASGICAAARRRPATPIEGREVVLADGSARTLVTEELTQPVAQSRPWGSVPVPVHATVDGLAGVDY